MKNPVEVQLPAPNRFLIILCMDESGEQIPSALLDDFFLNLRYGAAVKGMVSGSWMMCIPDLTHLVSCSIASRTD